MRTSVLRPVAILAGAMIDPARLQSRSPTSSSTSTSLFSTLTVANGNACPGGKGVVDDVQVGRAVDGHDQHIAADGGDRDDDHGAGN